MQILIADPDGELVTILSYWLRSHGHDPLIAQNASETLKQWRERSPDLVVLDFALPGVNGPLFCRRLRQEGTGRIVVLTDPRQHEEEARALEEGADDYLAKPVSMRLLQARLNALGRRAQPGHPESCASQVKIGSTLVNLARYELIRNGRVLRLTPIEGRLLQLLLAHAGQVLPAGTILQRVWGDEDTSSSLIKTHIHHLRRKIEPDPDKPRFLLTLPTVGYLLSLQEPPPPAALLPPEPRRPSAALPVAGQERTGAPPFMRRLPRWGPAVPSSPSLGTRRVLVVDDDRDIRESVQEWLEDDGFQVASASDGLEALAVLHREGGSWLVLLDLRMPRLDGWGFLDRLQSDSLVQVVPQIVLMSAGWVLAQEGPPWRSPQVVAALPKPFEPADLLAQVHALTSTSPSEQN
jgi:DNA-binding response OmpR family regulator